MALPQTACSAGGWGGQHASPQKFDACTTIHFSLENFESVDLALGLAVAPALCHRVPYRADILPQCSDEALHCVQTGLLGVVEPGVEFIGAFASKNAAEAHGELTHHNEIRRCAL